MLVYSVSRCSAWRSFGFVTLSARGLNPVAASVGTFRGTSVGGVCCCLPRETINRISANCVKAEFVRKYDFRLGNIKRIRVVWAWESVASVSRLWRYDVTRRSLVTWYGEARTIFCNSDNNCVSSYSLARVWLLNMRATLTGSLMRLSFLGIVRSLGLVTGKR